MNAHHRPTQQLEKSVGVQSSFAFLHDVTHFFSSLHALLQHVEPCVQLAPFCESVQGGALSTCAGASVEPSDVLDPEDDEPDDDDVDGEPDDELIVLPDDPPSPLVDASSAVDGSSRPAIVAHATTVRVAVQATTRATQAIP